MDDSIKQHRELDSLVAIHAMGFEKVCPWVFRDGDGNLYTTDWADISLGDIPESVRPKKYTDIHEFNPSSNPNDFQSVLSVIVQEGRQLSYSIALYKEVFDVDVLESYIYIDDIFDIIFAPLEKRCRAALRAMGYTGS